MISIILPVYNAEKTISRAINSIISQNYADWELLIINDGSKDNTQNICKHYTENDTRIKLINQENKGVSYSRNEGIKNSAGKFIVFIDSDDEVKKNYLQCLIDDYNVSGFPDLVMQGFIQEYIANKTMIRSPGEKLSEDNMLFSLENNKDFFYSIEVLQYGFPFGKLLLRDIIIENNLRFDEKLSFCEDLVFLLEYIFHSKKIYISNQANYIYYFTPSSLSHRFHSFKSEYNSYLQVKDKYQNLLEKNNISEEQQKYLLFKSLNIINRPLASISITEKGNLSDKKKLVYSLDDEYFLILKSSFKKNKKFFYLSFFCNKKMWFIWLVLFSVKYRKW